MKAYISTPEELAAEVVDLQQHGVDEVAIMDSAGCMHPNEVKEYIKALKNTVSIPVGFHCHNNLGLSAANAIAAMDDGVDLYGLIVNVSAANRNNPTENEIANAARAI